MDNYLVSVIIPVFNNIKTLNNCITSIRLQTYKNIEIIIVDDGSEDGSYEECVALTTNDKRCLILQQEHKGVSAARNNALEHACGKFIMFCDADDTYNIDCIETMTSSYEDDTLLICGFNSYCCETVNHYVADKVLVFDKYDVCNQIVEKSFTYRYATVWNKIYSRDLILAKFDVRMHNSEDWVFNLNYIQNVSKVKVIPYCGCNHFSSNVYAEGFKYRASLIESCLYCDSIRKLANSVSTKDNCIKIDKLVSLDFARNICKVCIMEKYWDCISILETYRVAIYHWRPEWKTILLYKRPFFLVLLLCKYGIYTPMIFLCRLLYYISRKVC